MATIFNPKGPDFGFSEDLYFGCDGVSCLETIASNLCEQTNYTYSPLDGTLEVYNFSGDTFTTQTITSGNILDEITCGDAGEPLQNYGPSQLSQTGSIIVINQNPNTGDYTINIPSLLFLFSYIICLFFALFFLYFTTLFFWKKGKNI